MALRLATIELGLASPQYLVAGLLAAIFLALIWRKALRNSSLLEARLGGAGRKKLVLLPAARILAVILLASAAASPYLVVYRSIEVNVDNVDKATSMPVQHIILLDVSRSMGYSDRVLGAATRFEAAKEFVKSYLESLRNDNVTILVFSANLSTLCTGVAACLESLETAKPAQRYSAIGDAIAAASIRASVSGMPSIIVVVSDGGWNPYGSDPRDVARTQGNATPVIFVKVGSDPRATVIEEAARIGGYKLYNVDEFSLKALEDLVDEVRREARYEALRAAGMARIEVPERDYGLSTWVGVAALLVLLYSLSGGP